MYYVVLVIRSTPVVFVFWSKVSPWKRGHVVVVTSASARRSNNLQVASSDPEAMASPLGWKRTELMSAAWPSKLWTGCPVRISQINACLSHEPDVNILSFSERRGMRGCWREVEWLGFPQLLTRPWSLCRGHWSRTPHNVRLTLSRPCAAVFVR